MNQGKKVFISILIILLLFLSTIPFLVSAINNPSVSFLSKIPIDFNMTNLYDVNPIFSYNITPGDNPINISKVFIYYKLNDSFNSNWRTINGSTTSEYISSIVNKTNSSVFWNFTLDACDLYSGTHTLSCNTFRNTAHSNFDLTNGGDLIVGNISNISKNYKNNFLEIDIFNSSSSSVNLSLFYCNSSGSQGGLIITNDPNCGVITQANAGRLFNRTVNSSRYMVFDLGNVNSTGQIAGINVTSDSYFAFRGAFSITDGWTVRTIPVVTKSGTTRKSVDSGLIYLSDSSTIDFHVLQYNDSSTLRFYGCANDTSDNQGCDIERTDFLGQVINRIQHNVTLNRGWNYFGIIIGNISNRRIDVNVSLDGSINLIGFSALNLTNHSAVEYNNNTAISTWLDFAQNNSVQHSIAILNNSGTENKYNYYPYHQNYLSENVAGWYRISTNNKGNLTFKNIAGNYVNESYPFSNLTFYNTTGNLMNTSQAYYTGSVGSESDTATSYIQYWNSPLTRFESLEETQSLNSWKGYIIYSNQNNITLVVST